MRNLKKILALVLALVMSMSLVTVASAAYTDQDTIDARYNEAVQVLSGMGIFKGYENGSFNPKGLITREEVATMMYRVISKDVTDTNKGMFVEAAKFSDVANTKWSAGYIGYCYNGNYVKGYEDGTFGPAKNVTGYEVLAMILRAVGYDQNGEFSGSNWKKNIGTVAQQLGILNNVAPTVVLSAPATRELVAELIFRTMVDVDMVEYTPAFSYQPILINTGTATTTLGLRNFGLYSESVVEMDDWGRPAKGWFYNCGAKVTYLPYAKVFETNVETTECDIAKAVGFGGTKSIESAWVDGIQVDTATVTSNGVASIAALATTSEIGAQGRITEVYAIGNTLRVVEINTYLGVVTNVVPVYTDRNGHTTSAYIEVSVYANEGDATDDVDYVLPVAGNNFAVGEYVLVNVPFFGTNDAYVDDIKVANRAAAGQILGYTEEVFITPATHVLSAGTYKDADKFELNWRDTSKAWDVLTDSFGNIIGLVESATSYAVVEKIEWKHNASNFGGYALADVVLANGERVSGVTIATVDGNPANNYGDAAGVIATALVSDDLSNNDAYYYHIFMYSVNANGSYNLATIADHVTPTNTHGVMDVTIASYYTGNATIDTNKNTIVATDYTVFLMMNDDGYTYTTYVGKNAVPNFVNATACVMVDTNGFAKLVVADGDLPSSSSKMIAYITDKAVDSTIIVGGNLYNGHMVYKLGETTPTTVYTLATSDAVATAFDTTNTGIYLLTTDSNNIISGIDTANYIQDLAAATQGDATLNYNYFSRYVVKEAITGNSFQVEKYDVAVNATANGYTISNTAVGYDYSVDANTKYISVTKHNGATGVATIAPTTAAAVQPGKIVVMHRDYGDVLVVYIIEHAGVAAVTPPAATDTFALTYKSYENGAFVVKGKLSTVALDANDSYTVTIVEKNTTNEAFYAADVAFSAVPAGTEFTFSMAKTGLAAGKIYTISITFTMADGEVITCADIELTI